MRKLIFYWLPTMILLSIIIAMIFLPCAPINTKADFGSVIQERDQDCDRLAIPEECKRISDSITSLQSRLTSAQARLERTSPAGKADLLNTIDDLNKRIEQARTDLRRCLDEEGANPRRMAAGELTTLLTGDAQMQTTDGNAPGPFNVDLDIDLRFSRTRCELSVTRFPRITLRTKNLPVVGVVRIDVTKTGGGRGSFHPVTGRMSVPITLHLHYDNPLISDDDATFFLTTENSVSRNGTFNLTGSPIGQRGNIRLVGTTRFQHGYLAGKEGSLTVTANISPHP